MERVGVGNQLEGEGGQYIGEGRRRKVSTEGEEGETNDTTDA